MFGVLAVKILMKEVFMIVGFDNAVPLRSFAPQRVNKIIVKMACQYAIRLCLALRSFFRLECRRARIVFRCNLFAVPTGNNLKHINLGRRCHADLR